MFEAIMKADWHLDKGITLGLIGALVAQGASIVWWASQQDARISQLEYTQQQHGVWLVGQRDQILAINERTIRMEEQLAGVRTVVNSIENYVRQRGADAINGGKR